MVASMLGIGGAIVFLVSSLVLMLRERPDRLMLTGVMTTLIGMVMFWFVGGQGGHEWAAASLSALFLCLIMGFGELGIGLARQIVRR